MFTVTEVASLSDSQPAYRILKPWWDVFLDYLGIVMLMLSIFAGTMQFSRDPLCCLPKLDENVTCLSDSAIQKSLLATASPDAPTKDSSPSGRQTGMEYMQYIFVNQKCYHDVLPWISKYMPFLALIHTVILMASSNFWFKYPKTSSKLEHFVSILGKCFESPWTTKALSETACEESEVTGTAPQHQSKLSDHASPPKSNLGSVSASDGGSLNPSMPMFSKDQESVPLAPVDKQIHETSIQSGVSVTILDKKDGEQAKALFEKVRKFRLHVEESDIIYQLYTLQSLVKTLKILLIVGYTSYFVDQIQFLHECAPDVEELIGYTTFCCTHTLAYLLRKVLYTYMAVVVLYGLVCFYTLYWLFKRPLKEYSFEKVREESNFSDIPDVKNDFAFLMHMIDQYDSLYSKRFAVFLSEVSENKLRQLSLNHEWSYEKLRQHVTKNAQDKMELHLLMLSGVPEAVFDILDLEILKLELIPDVKLPAKISQMSRLQELWLHHCPAKCDASALSFLRDRLRVLHLKFTDVDEIPAWIYTLRNLRDLYLIGNLNSENNKVIALESLRELRHLKLLQLKSNLAKIPSNLADIATHLQKLYIHNDGTHLLVLNNLKKLVNLTELELQYCELERIPHAVFSLMSLQEIDLKGNSIQTIEEIVSFQHLKRLTSIKLWHNKIAVIPASIAYVKNLERLNLSNNKLEAFPNAVLNCVKLRHLELNHNQIESIPLEVGTLQNLQHLSLSNNRLKELPAELSNCSRLRMLLLSGNQLKDVPAGLVRRLPQLHLEIKGNPIETTLPEVQILLESGGPTYS